MKKAAHIGKGFHGILAVLLASLLGLQVAFAYQPALPDASLRADEVILQLCDGAGLHRVAYDPVTGAVRDLPETEGRAAAKCPFCVLGLTALPVLGGPPDFVALARGIGFGPVRLAGIVPAAHPVRLWIRGPPSVA
ncbi:hypothetical protein [Thioclava sp. GXIMD4216]|uniref:hypothetical protein n=1 Tax=unclassified Thioclava TaxID=2621713 RepID=UPI0030CB3840